MAGSTPYDEAVDRLRRTMHGEHADDDLEAHADVVVESLVVCDLGPDADRDQAPDADRDNMAPDADRISEAPDHINVISDVPDHISVITEAPSLHDVQEADGLPPVMPINVMALIPPTPKKIPAHLKKKKAPEPKPPQPPKLPLGPTPKWPMGKAAKPPQPPKMPPPERLMAKFGAGAHGVDAGVASDHPTDHASDSSRAAADAAAMPPPPPPTKPKMRRTYGDAASSADVADPPPPEPFGEGPPRKRASIRQTTSDPCDADGCGHMREADECRYCAAHCEDRDCTVHWSFPLRCAMSSPVWCKHKRPHPNNADCIYCRQHCADPDCAFHKAPASQSATRIGLIGFDLTS